MDLVWQAGLCLGMVRVGDDIAQGRSKVTPIASQALLYGSLFLPLTILSLIAYILIVIFLCASTYPTILGQDHQNCYLSVYLDFLIIRAM